MRVDCCLTVYHTGYGLYTQGFIADQAYHLIIYRSNVTYSHDCMYCLRRVYYLWYCKAVIIIMKIFDVQRFSDIPVMVV